MRDHKMEEIAEVEMPPHSKRPRLEFVAPELDSSGFHGKTISQGGRGIHADAGFQACGNGIADVDSSKNGVMKTNMADAVSAVDLDLNSARNDVTDVSEDGKQSPDTADTGNESDSDISNISGGSEMAWRPMAAGPMAWVQEQMLAGRDPRVILRRIIPDPDIIPDHLEDFILWKIVASIVSEPPRRKKLKHINTIEDVVTLLKTSKKIIVLTGAGVSVSCGIPDFRSRDGIYARLAVDFPDLPDPQAMFDINYFRHDPRPFFKFAKEIYPGQFEPSRCHKFISLLDHKGKLLHNYTQNIDTLEQVAGIKNVIQCHGSFATATCMTCRYKVDAEAIRKDIFDQVIPHCPRCSPSSTEAVMKPDIVFFGESLPEEFHTQMAADKDVCDLLIVVGSSLKVRPVALIPNSIPPEIPQVLINREPLRHLNFDVELLGDCDVILGELCHRLGGEWSDLFRDYTRLEEVTKGELSTPTLSESGTGIATTSSESDTGNLASCTRTSTQPCSSAGISGASSNSESSSLLEIKSGTDVSSSDTKAASSSDAKAKGCDSIIPCQIGASVLPDSKGDSHVSTCTMRTKGDNSASSSQNPNQDHDNKNGTSEQGVSASLLRDWWESKHSSISSRLLSNQYLYIPPHRHVFKGAEVYSDSESEDGQYDDADEESSLSDFDADNEPSNDMCSVQDGSREVDSSRLGESHTYGPCEEVIKNGGAIKEPQPSLAAEDGVAAHTNGHPIDFGDTKKAVSGDAAIHGSAVVGESVTAKVAHHGTDKCCLQNGATPSDVTWTQSSFNPS